MNVDESRGVHPPWDHDAFPPSDSPLFFEQFSYSVEHLLNVTFSRKIFDFHPPKFLMTFFSFFSHRPQISNFSLFSLFRYILPPCFAKICISPYLKNFPSVFEKFACVLHTLCVFPFPPSLTMMHLCITQCTHWTPLDERGGQGSGGTKPGYARANALA